MKGLVESVCPKGHHWLGELAPQLPLSFREDLPLAARCPVCGKPMRVLAGTYEKDGSGIYRRVGPGASSPKG